MNTLDTRQTATVLAALRLYQAHSMTLAARPTWDDIMTIATDGGKLAPLSNEEIDKLTEVLNFDGLTVAEPGDSKALEDAIDALQRYIDGGYGPALLRAAQAAVSAVKASREAPSWVKAAFPDGFAIQEEPEDPRAGLAGNIGEDEDHFNADGSAKP